MDVSGSKLFFLLVLLFITAGCGSQRNSDGERVFKPAPPNDECQQAKVEDRFLVQWKSGRVSLYKNLSKKELFSHVLEPNIEIIESAEHDYKFKIQPTDLQIELAKTEMINNWGLNNIGVAEVWKQNVRGSGVRIAVTDSGVDFNHDLLKGRIAVNQGEIPENGIDDDGNGYVDDYYGFNSAEENGNVMDIYTGPGENPGHGTHVSGIIAAEHSFNEIRSDQIQGMAPEAQIIPVKIFTHEGYAAWAVAGIEYAIQRGVNIINASWGGGGCSDILRNKVYELDKHNILFVAASGNNYSSLDTNPVYPASFAINNLISVGAIDEIGLRPEFSSYSYTRVHLYAPGVSITSAMPYYDGRPYHNNVQPLSGTSMAAPYVSGAAALIWSYRPNATASQIRQAIFNSVVEGPYVNATNGRLNLEYALEALDQLL